MYFGALIFIIYDKNAREQTKAIVKENLFSTSMICATKRSRLRVPQLFRVITYRTLNSSI